jgi:hypothetical protein
MGIRMSPMIVRTDIDQAIAEALEEWAPEAYVITLKEVQLNLSGRVLNKRTRRLFDSIPMNSTINSTGFSIGTNVFYGIAWETGFHRKAYAINPKSPDGVLHWIDRITGDHVFAKYCFIPEQTFAARPWLSSAFEATEEKNGKLMLTKVHAKMNSIFPGGETTVKVL